MKKVMLVDDEILVRESIRDCINWEQEGFIFCGDASDGELALPLIEQRQPDILITDIKMPFMDGLELSAIVRERMPDIKIIILSGHDEFEYARAALRVGVEEYCLKPVSAADIVRTLNDVSRSIDRERYERELLEKKQLAQGGSAEQMRHKLLSDLCSGFITTAEAIHQAGSLSIGLTASYYAAAISDIRCSEGSVSVDLATQQQTELLLHEAISSLLPGALSYKRSQTETIWLLKSDSLPQLQEVLARFASSWKEQAERSASCTIAVGIGSIQDRLQGIHSSYLEAEDDKHWRRLSGQNRKALRDAASGLSEQSVVAQRQRFIDFLKLGTPAKTEAFVASFAAGLQQLDWRGAFYGYYLLNDLTIEAVHIAKSIQRNPDMPKEQLDKLQLAMSEVRSQEDACCYLQTLLAQFWQWRAGAADKYAEMLSQVKDYILKHYGDDHLSLNDAAEHVRVSPSHLSKVFSQETGQTFIEFLTHTRIRKAMELLQASNAKSYEIAHQVGYNDAHYFSNLFKRVTGMTTTQFRKQQEQGGSSPAAGGVYHHASTSGIVLP
ncbi:response regulator [Paenibacillus sp. FSL H8-0537]|uniref:response regulator transcription factor n=1 Tax=Paenibacillus sp. FSL H8-0537 TaxID=2921399 RepID=UPI00310196B2